ncbi:Flagellar motor rotation protein MotA [hydrothermal vent metagenome]|uniref:Flagellar motor rotation protein MotA n=1 Tax=hydrothermal vent metagenome TaxID=652676 RepID=A0A3B1ATS6_9ZZZZ
MTRSNWLAAFCFAALFSASFMLNDDRDLFINTLGLLIVISGTLGALFLSYPTGNIIAALKVSRNAYLSRLPTTNEIVDTLIYLSVHSRQKGVLVLENAEEETSISFLKRALGMLVDNFSVDELRDILYTEMYYFKQRRSQHERLFRHAARLAPAFGVAGSVIGLITMLSGIGNPEVILKTIPVALTSTLYGIVIGNFLLMPMAENISVKTSRELMIQKLITDGVIAIRQEQNSQRLLKKLESFLTPSAREDKQQTFEEIRERVRSMRLDEA